MEIIEREINSDKKFSITPTEITITIKDDEKSVKAKYLIYENFMITQDDPIICSCVAKTLESFHGEPEEVRVRINFSL